MSFRQRTIDPLAQLELFAGCTPSEILRARQLLTMVTVEPGTVLMEEGRYGMEFLIIADGEAAVSIGGYAVATLGRGDFTQTVVGILALGIAGFERGLIIAPRVSQTAPSSEPTQSTSAFLGDSLRQVALPCLVRVISGEMMRRSSPCLTERKT